MNILKHFTSWVILGVFIIFGVCSVPTCYSAEISVDDLSIMTELGGGPYTNMKNNKLQGISVELMERMLKMANSRLSGKDIQRLPWARGYMYLLNKKNSCLFSTARTKEREDLFKWVGPIDKMRVVLIAPKYKKIKINSFDDLKKYSIGTVIDDVAEKILLKKGVSKDIIQSVPRALQNARKLFIGRIDMWAVVENAANRILFNTGFDTESFETVYVLKEIDLHYAFNKSIPDNIIKQFQINLDELKSNGEYQKIFNRHIGSCKDDYNIVKIHIPVLEDSPRLHMYFHELLQRTIFHSGYRPILIPVKSTQQNIYQQLDNGDISIYWLLESIKRNNKYIPLSRRITNGLIGKRILFINKEDQRYYDNVNSLDDFRKLNLVGGMGKGWYDVNVWKANNLKYKEQEGNWGVIFQKIITGNDYDYIARGLNEIVDEAEQHKRLYIEKKLVLIYDRDFSFYLSKTGKNAGAKYIKILTEAFKNDTAEKLKDKLIQKYWGDNFKIINYDKRVKIKLETPP